MDKIAEKIKALLAKAASTTNEHEAEVFFAKAYELMEKHQLDFTDLDKEDPVGEEDTYERKGAAAPDWDFRLLFACARYFGCRGVQYKKYDEFKWIGHYMKLVGRESARVTAIEMHKYLVNVVRKLGREHAQEFREKPETASRRIGVALYSRLCALAPKPDKVNNQAGKNALVTVNQVEAYLKDKLSATPIKGNGAMTTERARKLAEGIGLHLQTGNSSTLKIGG